MSKGIESLKSLTEFVILAFQATIGIDSNKDRKVSLTEALTVVTQVGFKVPGIYDRLPEIRAEWKDLSDQEIQELVAWFSAHFDLPQHVKLEEIIRSTAQMLVYNYQYYKKIKAILTPVA